jgi:hypothetical protein
MNDHDLTSLIPPASSGGTGGRRRCPDEARLAAFVEGTLPSAVRETVVFHLADCAFCRGQVGFLVRAERLGPAPAVPTHLLTLARGERSWWTGRLRPATAVAAALGMALALFLVTSRGRRGILPAEGKLPGAAIVTPSGIAPERSVRTSHGTAGAPRIVRPIEGESISRNAVELRWEEVSGALFYTVQLVDQKGGVVWEGRAEGAHLTVPAAAPLVPGQPYFAWVLAHLRSGATARSPAVGFRLARE